MTINDRHGIHQVIFQPVILSSPTWSDYFLFHFGSHVLQQSHLGISRKGDSLFLSLSLIYLACSVLLHLFSHPCCAQLRLITAWYYTVQQSTGCLSITSNINDLYHAHAEQSTPTSGLVYGCMHHDGPQLHISISLTSATQQHSLLLTAVVGFFFL